MGRGFISTFIACTLLLSNTSYAATSPEGETIRGPKRVSKLPPENKYNPKKWSKYAIAAGAVIIAVVTLVLVSRHHKDHEHHKHHHH
ncbi:MAG: hypothetical protein HYX48_06170 [Chlamydiales bacterium]|nr:hypothetical protein [Chlamydiales bacterium]